MSSSYQTSDISPSKDLINLRLFMEQSLLPCPDEIQLDGNLHRYSARQGKDQDEWYIGSINPNGTLSCTFGSWRTGFDNKSWFSNSKMLSPEEAKLNKEWLASEALKYQAEQARLHEASLERVNYVWNNAQNVVEHTYLTRKQIIPLGIRIYNGMLVIPCSDITGKLQAIQFINDEGKKKFNVDSRTANLFFSSEQLTENTKEIYVAEGYATAVTLATHLHKPVVAAMSASNMTKVGILLSVKYPLTKLVFCGEIGKASETALKDWKEYVSANILMPKLPATSKGTDFNDVMIELGKEELIKQTKFYLIPTANILDFMSRKIDPLRFIIDHLLVESSINLLFSDAGVGKSYFAIELGIAVATGLAFQKYTTKKSKVLLIDTEMRDAEIKARLNQIIARRKRDNEDVIPDNFHIYSSDLAQEYGFNLINLYDESSYPQLKDLFAPFELIVIDNYFNSAFAPEDGSWSDGVIKTWVRVSRFCKELTRLGKCFLILHHAGSGGSMQGATAMSYNTTTNIKLTATQKYNQEKRENLLALGDVDFVMTIQKGRHLTRLEKIPIHYSYGKDEEGIYRWKSEELFNEIG